MYDTLRMVGKVRLIWDEGLPTEVVDPVIDNLVMLLPRQLVLRAFAGDASAISQLELKGISLGTGTTAPIETDTQLAAEVARKSLTSAPVISGSTIVARAFYSNTEASVVVTEMGLWGGPTFSPTLNSGTLISRIGQLYKDKRGNKTMTIEWSLNIEV